MSVFTCPVCGRPLELRERSFVCENSHSYDIAKSGYVNLLMSNQSGKRHGDDAAMVRSRRDFLDRGFYGPLLSGICEMLSGRLSTESCILDCGCGDCYYTAGLIGHLASEGVICSAAGIDISKDALKYAAKRRAGIALAVASAYKLPVAPRSCDLILNIFSPLALEEFSRVLKSGGLLLKVIPLERHLMGLKAAVYDVPYENPSEDTDIDGFECIERKQIKYTLSLPDNEAIMSLFMMTPYYYKTGEKDQKKLAVLDSLDTPAEFEIRLYKKIG